MDYAVLDRILSCPHNNGHENYGEGNICVECRAKSNDIKEANQLAEKVDCPACFGEEEDEPCDACKGRGYFLRPKVSR